MKKITLFTMLCFILALVSCTKTTDSASVNTKVNSFDKAKNTEYNFETDSQNYFSEYADIVKVDGGYYAVYGMFLYFINVETADVVPVCSNPACDHRNTQCDAFIGDASFVQFYDNYLFYEVYDFDSRNCAVYKRTLDGSKVEKIFNMQKSDYCPPITVHRGYLYYSLLLDGNSSALYRAKLENDTKAEKLFVYEGYDAEIYRIKGYGDGVVFETLKYLDKDYEENSFSVYYYDSSENAVKIILDNTSGDYCIAKDSILYQKQDGIYKYDLQSKTDVFLYQIVEPVYLSYDGRYIYLDNKYALFKGIIKNNERKVYVVDLNGNIIDTIELNDEMTYYGDEDYFFHPLLTGIQMFDKKQLGTGDFTWIKLPLVSYDNINFHTD